LAKPGADIGDLIMLMSTNTEYQLEFSKETLIDVFIQMIGGWEKFKCHTDEDHKTNTNVFIGDSYYEQVFTDPEAFSIKKDDMEYIQNILQTHEKEITCTILNGDHEERAMLMVKSDKYSMYSKQEKPFFEAFIYQKTLDNKRRRLLAKNLLPHVPLKGIQFTEEYLYEVMSQVADNQLLEIVSRLAKNIPIFDVVIDESGNAEINEQ
jgi:hypothetical protein